MKISEKIRRMHMRDKLSLHEIAKRTGLSRNTIRKWLQVPKENVPAYVRKNKTSKLSAYHAVLEQALKTNAHRPKQDRRTATALLAHIRQLDLSAKAVNRSTYWNSNGN